jgi:2-polyprenyl-6-methoxyphenol hydroxylase-like FAD-dependent oxidoreductase
MQQHHEVVIAGGGIGGLILALCLDAQYNHPPSNNNTKPTTTNTLEINVYESASEFSAGAGGAIGLYANGLRILRDISTQHPLLGSLLDDVRAAVSIFLLLVNIIIMKPISYPTVLLFK